MRFWEPMVIFWWCIQYICRAANSVHGFLLRKETKVEATIPVSKP
jgi:hypothetical protein